MSKKRPQAHLKILSKKGIYKYIYYMYKEDLALNNLQWLISHKTQPNQTMMNKMCDLKRKKKFLFSYQTIIIFKK